MLAYNHTVPTLMLALKSTSSVFVSKSSWAISSVYLPLFSPSPSNLKSPKQSLVVSSIFVEPLSRVTRPFSTQSATPSASTAILPPMKHFS
jgi:hypothetical protein